MISEDGKPTIVFIVTSFWAYGELLIALEFAKRAPVTKYRVHFFIPSSHEKILKDYNFEYTVLIPHSRKINRLLFSDFEQRRKPAFIILSDFLNYHFCENHYGLLHEDLELFSGKLGAFDNFDWEHSGRFMDTYGFKAKNMDGIDLSLYGFRLIPSPIVSPRQTGDSSKYYYSLIDTPLEYTEKERLLKRNKLKLNSGKKIILTTSATWQETHKAYPEITNFVKSSNAAFKTIIRKLSENYLIICIGPESFFTPREINQNYVLLGQQTPEVFNEYLQASDLFLSRNLTSTTQARAVVSGIPTVLLANSYFFNNDTRKNEIIKSINDPDSREVMEPLNLSYPFLMFPVGWYKFLKPHISSNPYSSAYRRLEIFEINRSVLEIEALMEGRQEKKIPESDFLALRDTLQNLTSIPGILQHLEEKGGSL